MQQNSIGIVFDLVFLAVLCWVSVQGMRRGFVSGALRLVGVLAGFAAGTWAANTLAQPLYRDSIGKTVGEKLAEKISEYGNDLFAALQDLDFLPSSLYDRLESALLSSADDMVPSVISALEPVILPLVQSMLFILVCLTVRLLVRSLSSAFRQLNRLPILGGLNKALGFAFGFAAGVLDCWLLAQGLWLAGYVTNGSIRFLREETLNLSAAYRLFSRFSLFGASG